LLGGEAGEEVDFRGEGVEEGGFGFLGAFTGEGEMGEAGDFFVRDVEGQAAGEGEEGGAVEGDTGFGHPHAGPDGLGVEGDAKGGELVGLAGVT